ncbi:hypothetical protein M3Y97_00872900 [Aphelenchoides bicaudatus]|nr:hypothetical protein M3Y97_00872900 [Aphelenchoides bicaudatus]
MVRRLRAEEIDLVDEFNKWKHATKNHYKQLLSLEKDTQALRQVIFDLEQKIKHAQREADRLCNDIEAYEKKVVPSSDKVVQTTERLAQRPEPFKNLLNASGQRVESVLVQRSAQTSSFSSQRFVEQEVQQVKHVQQLRYNIKPLNEPLFGKVSNVGSILSKKAEDSDNNSSIISLVEDENVLGFTKPTANVLNKASSPDHVPLLNFNPLNISGPPIQPIMTAFEERSASSANTEHDISSIAFDEQSVSEFAKSPANKSPPVEQHNEPSEKEQTLLNVSSHSIGEVLPNIDEIEVQNEAFDASSEHLVNESIVELEETREEFRPLDTTNATESKSLSDKAVELIRSPAAESKSSSDKVVEVIPAESENSRDNFIESVEPAKSIRIDAKSLSVDEVQSVESVVVDKAVNLTEEEIHVEHMTSESVASELLSSALDDSLAQLDELAQDSSQPSNKSSSSVASTAKSSSQKDKKSSSSSSLKSPPTASDKSILKASSFKISSEMQLSVDSKQSKDKTVSDASSSSDF